MDRAERNRILTDVVTGSRGPPGDEGFVLDEREWRALQKKGGVQLT